MRLFENGDDAFYRQAIVPKVYGIFDLASPFESRDLRSKRGGIVGVENPRRLCFVH
jgi:hypothetical protein